MHRCYRKYAMKSTRNDPRGPKGLADEQASGRKVRRGLMGKAQPSRHGGMAASIFPKARNPG
jgi:hypothetical protein